MVTFKEFITWYNPSYIVDDQNESLFLLLDLYARRQPEFENPDLGRYLDKGICLTGNVGTGKTEIMRMLHAFISYIKSPYVFKYGFVWKYAELFSKSGYACFNALNQHNWYFDELALTDEKTGIAVNEITSHYGDKILIGEALIRRRYESFKSDGLITHFSSNCPPKSLDSIYGSRAFSRLCEMSNFLTLTGKDRRLSIRPNFRNNKNIVATAKNSNVSIDESSEHKNALNKKFNEFLETGIISKNAEFDFDALKFYGCDIGDNMYLNKLKEDIKEERKEQIQLETSDPHVMMRNRDLIIQYRMNKIDKQEQAVIWREARKRAILNFYESQKKKNITSLFC